MEKIIIINQAQFGYHTDTFEYCKYLNEYFTIYYYCWDYLKPKLKLPNINIIYENRNNNKLLRNLKFIFDAILYIRKLNPKIVFIKYFFGCSILKLFVKKTIILDIRTAAVNKERIKRIIFDSILKFESSFFQNITIISKNLAEYLNLDPNKVYLLPLGATIIPGNKTFQNIKLLYVGTYNNRNIDKAIIGFSKFYKIYKKKIEVSFSIIGFGNFEEEKRIREEIKDQGLSDVVTLLGHIPYSSLKDYFLIHNIGLSFIPITSYFENQPPTKTFEYLLSGMPVIATATVENKKIINHQNGILINDSADDVFQGLIKIYSLRHSYNSERIRQTCIEYEWKNIVVENLIPIFNSCK